MNRYVINGESIYNPTESEVSHFGRIKIESPDQFVPLFLAQINDAYASPSAVSARCQYYIGTPSGSTGVSFNLHTRAGGDLQRINHPLGGKFAEPEQIVEIITKDLEAYLNKPVPKEYALQIHHKKSTVPNSASSNGAAITISGGHVSNYFLVESSSDITALGFYSLRRNTSPQIGTLKAGLYEPVTVNLLSPDDILPQFLIVIKAKHLAYIRACLYLQMPWSLAVTDIKLLRTANVMQFTAVLTAWDTLKGLIEGQGLEVAYVTSDEIKKYLFKPYVAKTAVQVLEAAKQLILQDIPFVSNE